MCTRDRKRALTCAATVFAALSLDPAVEVVHRDLGLGLFAAEPAAEQAVAVFRKLGAKIEVDDERPGKPVVKLSITGSPATDADLGHLKAMPELRELALHGFQVHDAGVARVKELAHLQSLRLNYTQVTDEGLAVLQGLSKLKSLNLDGSFRITDGGLRHLNGLRALENVSLTFTQVTDRGIEGLQRSSPKLRIHRRYAIGGSAGRKPDAPSGRPESGGGIWRILLDRAMLNEAESLKSRKDWIGLALVLEDMLNAHPKRVFQWRVYAWNLAYNLSAEFEDVRDRYFWVRQAFPVLLYAQKANPKEGALAWDIGWFVGHKIGRADDHLQFRQLFAEDEELHKLLIVGRRREDVLGPNGKPDNWLVARPWFLKAEPLRIRAFDPESEDSPCPILFCSDAPMCQIRYAEAIEKEGVFGEAAARAWKEAGHQWDAFGDRQIPIDKENTIRLNDLPKADAQRAELIRRYGELANFEYWKSRCRIEQLPTTIEGRRLLHEAMTEYEKARVAGGDVGHPQVRQLFERAFQSLRKSLDAEPALLADEPVCNDLLERIALYRDRVMRVQRLPEEFPLKPVIDRWEKKQ